MTLFELYKSTGQAKKALDVMQLIVQKKRDNKTLLKYAEALYLSGVYATAESTIKDITATDPENIPALMLFGKSSQSRASGTTRSKRTRKSPISIPTTRPPCTSAPKCTSCSRNCRGPKRSTTARSRPTRITRSRSSGLPKWRKSRKNMADYQLHLDKAVKLDPNDKQIQEEAGTKKKK